MKSEWQEERIRQRYHELRARDERLAPSFARQWDAAASGVRKTNRLQRLLPAALAGALSLVLGVSAALFFSGDRSPTPSTRLPSAVVSITSWRSPTLDLLRPPLHLRGADGGPGSSPQLAGSLLEIRGWRSPTAFLMSLPGELVATRGGES